MNPERELAKAKDFDIQIEDHGIPVLSGYFDYEGGSAQGLGYFVDMAFVMRFMGVFGVEYLHRVEGKSCWVTHTNDKILSIEPLHAKDGTPFVIQDWIDWNEEHPERNLSAYEMRTGKKSRA